MIITNTALPTRILFNTRFFTIIILDQNINLCIFSKASMKSKCCINHVSSFLNIHYLLEASYWSENFFRHTEQKCCGYWIGLTHNARVCNASLGKVSLSHCYLDRQHSMKLFMSMTKNILNNCYTLQYQEQFLIRYLILYAYVDHSMYYKFYLKKIILHICLIPIAH